MHDFFLRKFTKSRAQLPRGFDAPVLSRSSLQYHNILGSTIFKLFKSRWVPGCTAAGMIPWEFANRQLVGTDAGMYSLISQEIDVSRR
jgi:hypothetical protein